MPPVTADERESTTNNSSRSSSFTTGSSTGTGVHVSPTSGSQENSDLLDDDQSWEYADEIEPSESASRPRPSHYRRSNSRPTSIRRRPIRRHTTTERTSHRPPLSRVHRHAAPAPPSSVDPQEDYPAYGRGFLPPNVTYGGRAPQPGYAASYVSISPNPFQGNAGPVMPYGGPAAYPYPQNPFSPAPGVGGQGYFPPHQTAAFGAPGYGGHEVMPYGQAPGYGYGGYGIPPQAPPSQFYAHYAERPPSPKGTPAPAASVIAAEKEKSEIEKKLAALEQLLADSKLEAEKTKQEAERVKRETEVKKMASLIEAEKAKREAEEKKLAALERLLADTKLEAEKTKQEAERVKRETEEKKLASLMEAEKAKREAEEKKLATLERLLEDTKHEAAKAKKLVAEREAADKKAADEAAAKEATDKKVKEEVAKVKAEAEKKTKAAEEATKKAEDEKKKAEEEKKAADEAKAKAEADAKALLNPTDKKKPIRFKDAVNRKFSFPFHLCQTWAGMEELIRQAFLHVDVIGPHVAEGHYDLVGPNGEIILPQVWETMIEPDWAITMHMWPLPEQPKGPPEGVTVIDADPRLNRPPPRRRGDRGQMPPPGRRGPAGPPPPPPPGWIGPPPPGRGGHDMGGDPNEVIVIEDNGIKQNRKKSPKDTGGVLGMFGKKQSGKGPKKAESYNTCQVM